MSLSYMRKQMVKVRRQRETDQVDSSILAAAGKCSGPPCSHTGTDSMCSRSVSHGASALFDDALDLILTRRNILARRSSFEDEIRSVAMLQCDTYQRAFEESSERDKLLSWPLLELQLGISMSTRL